MTRSRITEAELREIATGMTSTWRVYKKWVTRGGDLCGEWATVEAKSEDEAIRKGGKRAVKARPFLPTRVWLELYAQHGRPKPRVRRRRP